MQRNFLSLKFMMYTRDKMAWDQVKKKKILPTWIFETVIVEMFSALPAF